MIDIRCVAIVSLCILWLSTIDGLTRQSTPHPYVHTKENPTHQYYFPFPTENCPDECMYIAECGKGRTALTEAEISGGVNVSEAFFATGTGSCDGLYKLDPEYCPIASFGECLMKCAGLRCSTPEHNGFDVYDPIPSDNYERMVEAYRKANNTKLTMSDFRRIQ